MEKINDKNITPSKALVIGCGYTGIRIANELKAHDYQVSAIRRSWSQTPSDIECIAMDVSRPYELKTIFDLIVYCVSAEVKSSEAYKTAYSLGIVNSLQACQASFKSRMKPHFVFISSTGVYAENSGNIVDEYSKLNTNSFSSEFLIEGENHVLQSNFNPIILRASGIYGPDRNYIWQKRNESYAFKNNSWSNRIQVDDLARACLHLASKNLFGTFNISDNQPSQIHEIISWISSQTNENITLHPNNGYESGKRVSNQKILDTDFKFKFPTYKEGFKQSIDEYLRNQK